MAKKRPSAIDLARAGSAEVERMAGKSPQVVEVQPAEPPLVRSEEPNNEPQPPYQGNNPSSDVSSTVEETRESINTRSIEAVSESPESTEHLYALPLTAIKIGGINTRVVDEESTAFRELVESIKKDGQLEPVIVGREPDGKSYRLIAGERRVRAIRVAGLPTVLARITDVPSTEWSSLMLIENLMRENLTVWEEAAGYKALLSTGMTQEEVGRRVHKGKTHVSLVLKIMRNPKIVAAIEEGIITSESMAKELSSLIRDDGQELYPGSLEQATDFIARRAPTTKELRAWVKTFLGDFQSPRNYRARKPTHRSTFLRSEQLRLSAVIENVSDMSPVEIAWLAKIYEEHAQRLRQVSVGALETHE